VIHGKAEPRARAVAVHRQIGRAVAGSGAERVLEDAPVRMSESVGVVDDLGGEAARQSPTELGIACCMCV